MISKELFRAYMAKSRSDEENGCSGEEIDDTICMQKLPETQRRQLLKAMAGGGGTIALAGCVGLFSEPEVEQPPEPADDDPATPDDAGSVFDIEYLNEGATIAVPEDQNLLEAGEEEGFDLPYSCRVGTCGECLAQVDGDGHELVEMTDNNYDPLDDDAIGDGYILTCTGQPREEFELETGVAGALDEDEEDVDEEEADDEDVDDEDAVTHDIEYVNQEATISVAEDQNLLEAGEDEGYELPYNCRVGVCGQCLAQVDGDGHELVEMTDNDYDPLDDDAISEGYVLTCTGQPRDGFELETGKAGEL